GGSAVLASANSDTEFKSFLVKFDLSAIPTNATIENASLSFYQIDSSSGETVVISAYKVTSSWIESSVSGSNMPTFDTGVGYGALSVDTNPGQKTFSQNFSDLAQSWLESPSSNFGLYFEATNSVDYNHEFGSRESSNKPSFSLTYSIPDDDNPTISNIEVTDVTKTGAKVSWNTDEEASSFVEYGTGESLGLVAGNEEKNTIHEVELTSLTHATTYYFKVYSEDEAENRGESSVQMFTTLPDGEEEEVVEKDDSDVSDSIAPPLKLKLTTGRDDNDKPFVELTWEHTKETEFDGYRIYRSGEDGVSYSLLTEVGKEKTSYKDETVVEGETYFYVVRTVIGSEESPDSNEEIVTIFGSRIEEELHKLNFWKGFIIVNVIVLPIFGVWYFVFRKKLKGKGGKLSFFKKKKEKEVKKI
ncbi:DNRLRE domain-containing protein, partial [Patescibacteria group bacterium]